MRPLQTRVLLTFAVPFLTACASLGSQADGLAAPALRAARDVPEAFVTESGDNPMSGCRSPLVDPRDDTRIRLLRSAAGRGDYVVPEGRYDLGSQEALRVHCPTGRVLGVVRR